MYRVIFVIAAAVGVSACSVSQPSGPVASSLEQLVQPDSDDYRNSNARFEAKPHVAAVAMLPSDAGSVVRVMNTSSVEGLRQEIFYDQSVAGLGDARIDIRIRTSDAVALDESLEMAKPTEAGIRTELALHFPKIAMQVVGSPRSNAYGPYGLAVGRWANGARCIYAWQWIDSVDGRVAGKTHPASIRIRYCRKGVTLDQMAGFVDRLDIDPNRSADPRKEVMRAPEAVKSVSENPARVGHRPGSIGRKVAAASAASSQPSRLSPVAIAYVPTAGQDAREQPLDQSLPAAAYRGPTVIDRASPIAGK